MSSRKQSSRKKPRRARRKFTAEFKADVVKLCETGTESIAEVSRRLDLAHTSVRAWVKQARADRVGGTPEQLASSEREELLQLRRQLKQVKMERDILKKATAFFARESS